MLETLAGNLKWERTADGIRVVIPSRFSWLSYSSSLGLLTLPHLTYDVFWKSGQRAAMGPRSFISEWIGLALFVFWIALFRTHKSVLTLTPAEMRVEKRALGFGLRKAISAASQLSDLRFVPSQYGLSVEDQSRVQYRMDNRTRSFGVGIGEDEADALIAKMMGVYPFPKYLQTISAAAVSATNGSPLDRSN
jgi:hypothetical protein